MADWNSLKPLKDHSTFMTVVVLCLAGVLFFTPRQVFRKQLYNSESIKSKSKVKAFSGLLIRDQPTTNGTILTRAPNNASLIVIDENAAQDVLNGKRGRWYKVEYQGITGYAWGNYIDK